MTVTGTVGATSHAETEVDGLIRDYHEARRREDQWRIPQMLLAVTAPILAFISVVFVMGGSGDLAIVSGVLTIVTSTGAALLALEVAFQHRTAATLRSRIGADGRADLGLGMHDPT